MKKPIYFIVYQGGIANVFKVNQNKPFNRERMSQGSFVNCQSYARGIRDAGNVVKSAWCNIPGDIAKEPWAIKNFDNAPFSDKFAIDLMDDYQKAEFNK